MGNTRIIEVLEPQQMLWSNAGLCNMVAGSNLKASNVSDLEVGDKPKALYKLGSHYH